MKEINKLLEKTWFRLLLLFVTLLLIITATLCIIFGVNWESFGNDSEEAKPKVDVYVHPMFKPVVKKGVNFVKSYAVAGNSLIRDVRLPSRYLNCTF